MSSYTHVKATPADLTSAAGKLEAHIAEYQKKYQELLALVEESAGWQGIDASTYAAQVEGFRDNLEAMVSVMQHYMDLLNYSAKAYTGAQDYLYEMGRKL